MAVSTQIKRRERAGRSGSWRRHGAGLLWLMVLPGLLLIVTFSLTPTFGLVIAFMDFNPLKGFFGSRWVGLGNFDLLFALPDLGELMRNTVTIAAGKIALGQILTLIFALLLNEVYEQHTWFKRIVQTLTSFPHFLSWVVIGGIMMDVLASNGILNQGLRGLGLDQPPAWLGDPRVFPLTMILSDVWKNFGWGAIIFLAAMTNVSPENHEAAAIDGAGRFQRMWHVTIPGIAPIVVLQWVLSIGNILNAGFDQILFLYNPAVYATGDVLDTYVYRVGIQSAQWSFGVAVGAIKSVISFALVLISWYLANRYSGWRPF